MLEGVDFNVSYAPVADIISLHIIIAIASTEGLIIFVLDIANSLENTIQTNPEEIFILVYHIYNWNG